MDDSSDEPVPQVWRPVFEEIVAALARGDFRLSNGIEGVEPVSEDKALRMKRYNYGATLRELPPESWETSVATRYGDRWPVLVDLWTAEEGRSDLVLHALVTEQEEGIRVALHLVYVP